ncbi:MAG: hypothetical protein JWQ14_2690 [Adhaeribacter sp.]|jgi:hypothetical protein|nr:hypothetical protein [Adhaeribacter sp.]
MMKTARVDILSRPFLLLALGLLLLNDFYLKYEYSNFLTGKLSDFAGLFFFPYFLSSLLVKSKRTIYTLTAFVFIFWKSDFSQELIEWWQTIGIGINRVVDHSDLIALLILPFSFKHFNEQLKTESNVHKALTISLTVVSLFAIWATTLPTEKVNIDVPVSKVFELKMSKAEFLKFNTSRI